MEVNDHSLRRGKSSQKLDTQIRQEQIAQASLLLVSQHGLAKLSLGRIAEQLGLVPSAIYRHFPNKDAVIRAMLELIQDRLLGNIRKVRRETSEPLEQLYRLLHLHVALVRENRGIPRLVFSEELFLAHPERQTQIYQTIRLYLNRVTDILRQGQEQGKVRADLDVDTLSVMFLGLVQPTVILHHMSEGTFDVDQHIKQSWKIFSEAISRTRKSDK